MTCVLAYKDENNHVYMASDRSIGRTVSWVNNEEKDIYYSGYTHKSALKNGVMVGGSGHCYICDTVINKMQFNTPYLREDSYDHYVIYDLLSNIHENIFDECYKYKYSAFLVVIVYSTMYLIEINYTGISGKYICECEKDSQEYFEVIKEGIFYRVLKYPNAKIMYTGCGGGYAADVFVDLYFENKDKDVKELMIKACQEAANHSHCDKYIDIVSDMQ